MRTTVELSDRTYRRLRALAAERGLRGFSPIVEEAVDRLLDQGEAEGSLARDLRDAEGAWSETDVEEWEQSRRKAWASWPLDPSSTPTS